MPRSTKEWIGRTDDSRPPTSVLVRLFEKAGGCCENPNCRIKLGPKEWHADHIKRLKDGGENRESNLQVLCVPCHLEKTGQEATLGAKALRIKAKTYGIKRPSRFPTARTGKWKVRWNKHTGRWETVPREPSP